MTERDPAATIVVPKADWPDRPDWDDIARVYEGDEPLKGIAEKYGLTVQKISAYAKRNGWKARSSRRQKETTRLGAPPAPKSQSTSALMKRLTGLVERQIAEIEMRLVDKGVARDHERDARTLSNLTRTLDKLVELKRSVEEERLARKMRACEKNMKEGNEEDADALRADLVRRLARLTSTRPTA